MAAVGMWGELHLTTATPVDGASENGKGRWILLSHDIAHKFLIPPKIFT